MVAEGEESAGFTCVFHHGGPEAEGEESDGLEGEESAGFTCVFPSVLPSVHIPSFLTSFS